MQTIQKVVRLSRVLPVLSFDSVEQGVAVCQALYDGGIRVFEITLRTPVALAVIQAVSQMPEVIIGAGTLLAAKQCEAVKKAGAIFGVSPGLTKTLHEAVQDCDLPFLPGVMTPSDVMQATEWGYAMLKFFPAQQAGGTAMLAALQGPFPTAQFCPTGGINAQTALDFLKLPNVVCVGGSWLTPRQAVQEKKWTVITDLAKQAMALSRNGSGA